MVMAERFSVTFQLIKLYILASKYFGFIGLTATNSGNLFDGRIGLTKTSCFIVICFKKYFYSIMPLSWQCRVLEV